jgi:parvulin-like peptidyl-prolyl isomerase
MKALGVFVLLSAAMAQTPAPEPPPLPTLPDETVVAVFDDGVKLTMGEFKRILVVLPPSNQQMVLRDRKGFLEQWALMRKLAQLAEKEKLAEASPAKEQLEYSRLMVLSQAKLNQESQQIQVDPAEIEKYYTANKDKYKRVKVRAIYIAFSTAGSAALGSTKRLTEAEAEAKANKLLTEIRGGADFVKLVKENSDDDTSKAKDGEFATLKPTDNIPDSIKTAVFSLKQGETGGPVRQAGGFYLLKADEVTYQPQSEVQSQIYTDLHNQQYSKWLGEINKEIKVQFPSAEFSGAAQAPAAPPKQ